MSVSKRLRYEVMRRDNNTCRYCGATPPDARMTIDHVVPLILGGNDDPSNLVTACWDCNSGKTSMPADAAIVADVRQDVWRWEHARRLAAEEWRLDQEIVSGAIELFDETWRAWKVTATGEQVYRPDDWKRSISLWLEYELTGEDIASFIEKAMTVQHNGYYRAYPDKEWRYLCGCIWGVIKNLQQRAAEIAEELPEG